MTSKRTISCIAYVLGAASFVVCATTAAKQPGPNALRVCSAASELPYSDKQQAGFENRVAEIVATRLHRGLEHVWWQDPRYYIRDSLDAGQCDLVVGIDSEDTRVLTTSPYYRSGYAFIYRTDRGLKIESWESPDLRAAKIILVVPNTPAEAMLRKIGRYAEMMRHIYGIVDYRSPRNQYVRFDPEKIVGEVSAGRADVAVLWAPEAARYVKRSRVPLRMALPAEQPPSITGAKLYFSTAMGVRKNDVALASAVGLVLKQHGEEINAVLRSEGIPTVPLPGSKQSKNTAVGVVSLPHRSVH